MIAAFSAVRARCSSTIAAELRPLEEWVGLTFGCVWHEPRGKSDRISSPPPATADHSNASLERTVTLRSPRPSNTSSLALCCAQHGGICDTQEGNRRRACSDLCAWFDRIGSRRRSNLVQQLRRDAQDSPLRR